MITHQKSRFPLNHRRQFLQRTYQQIFDFSAALATDMVVMFATFFHLITKLVFLVELKLPDQPDRL